MRRRAIHPFLLRAAGGSFFKVVLLEEYIPGRPPFMREIRGGGFFPPPGGEYFAPPGGEKILGWFPPKGVGRRGVLGFFFPGLFPPVRG